MRLILRFAKQCRKFLRYNLRPHTIKVENYLEVLPTSWINGKIFPFLPMILPHCNFRVWSFFIYGTLCSWLGPRWWEPRRSTSWSGISASLTRKLILFGVLKACTHTSLAFSYLVTSHELCGVVTRNSRREFPNKQASKQEEQLASLWVLALKVVHTSFSGITNHPLSTLSHANLKKRSHSPFDLLKKRASLT